MKETNATDSTSPLVERFFRHEAGRLHGALIRLLGTQRFHVAEEIAQEAMLRALRVWSMGGVPPNPAAWITKTAMNLARDYLRHERVTVEKEPVVVVHQQQNFPGPAAAIAHDHEIKDDMLRLLFACSHPDIAPDAQVVLALKTICGFNPAEIAKAFFASEAAIEKQLTRTKKRIQESGLAFEIPEGEELASRLSGVLGTLYLLFNEGYKASSGDQLLREDLCREAIRLTRLLVEHPAGDTPSAHALLAMMLLNAARFPTRTDEQGGLQQLSDQDRSNWNQELIDQGLAHLAAASQGHELSEYHLMAGIAALHCSASDESSTDWRRILRLYDKLFEMSPSPILALNRAVAVSRIHGPRAAMASIESCCKSGQLDSHYLFHAVIGELHAQSGDRRAAVAAFSKAISLASVEPERRHLQKRLRSLQPAPGER